MRRMVLPVTLVVTAGAVAAAAFTLGSADSPGVPVVVAPSPLAVSSARTPERAPSGDETVELVAQAFVSAFLGTGRDRDRRLEATTSERLGQLLARTDPSKVPAGVPEGSPRVGEMSDAGAIVTQGLSDGTSIVIDLVPDASRRGGWVVTSVRPGER